MPSRSSPSHRRRLVGLLTTTLILAGMLAIAGVAVAQNVPRPPFVQSNRNPFKPQVEPTRQAEAVQELLARGGSRSSLGPSTASTFIEVKGRRIPLPADIYIERVITAVSCPVGQKCPVPPSYVLRRGNSMLTVSVTTGEVQYENVAPNEQGAFDAFKRTLP